MTKTLFDRIIEILLSEMDDAGARKAVVTSAFHGSPVLRRIEWDGAAFSFTSRLVLLLDQFGEVSPGRRALVSLLEEVRKQVGVNVQEQIDLLLHDLNTPESADSAEKTGIVEGDDRSARLAQFRLDRIAEWSRPQFSLDKRFINLTLLLDQGKNDPQRWRKDDYEFNDLRDVLEKTANYPALVLLGAPGSGKSTLLRRLQLDHSVDRLRDAGENGDQISFFIQLNRYRAHSDSDLPEPREWLGACWATLYPELPPLDEFLRRGHALLLLDALNEMPHQSADDYRDLIGLWRTFAQEVAGQGNRLIFSCRTLDYSASLSSPPDQTVPHVEVQPMKAGQVQDFLKVYVPKHGARVWKELDGSPQFGLFQTPYFLMLLCEQVEATGEVPRGRAALFTGFVREALKRQIHGKLFQPGELLNKNDCEKLNLGKWRSPFDLPERGALVPGLSDLAFTMQIKGLETEGAQVRIDCDEAIEKIGHDRAEDIIEAGIALNVLDRDVAQYEISFFHQLLQEYFAARRLSKDPQPELVNVEWEAGEVTPSLEVTLAELADGDPLPPLGQTGWEETTLTASPMAKNPEKFIRELIPHNLPLAARCVASPEIKLDDKLNRLKDEIRQALVKRSQDQSADLRARIAAGEALGIIGDPRFKRHNGLHGECLLPPTVKIPGGTYPMGLDNAPYEREQPAHAVELEPFQIGQFPVTNAEYRLFIEAGGYDEEQWWDTAEAQAWRRGEGAAEGAKQAWRDDRKRLQEWTEDYIRGLVKQDRVTTKQAEDWITVRNWTDEELEQELSKRYDRDGKPYRQPEFWDDTSFNNPSQPVVGVTWYEARAYCNWLTANVGGGLIYRLPTEAEFEAAARGAKARMFPYEGEFDKERCNTFESYIRRTTPVGIFANATPERAFDLSGNAYTWTLSIYDQERFKYPYRKEDGRENVNEAGARRVLRGGSWYVHLGLARAVFRNHFHPADRLNNIGFRVVGVARPLLRTPEHCRPGARSKA